MLNILCRPLRSICLYIDRCFWINMLHLAPASIPDQLKSGYLRDFLKQRGKNERLSVNGVVQDQQWTGLNFVSRLTNVILFFVYLNRNINLIWLQKIEMIPKNCGKLSIKSCIVLNLQLFLKILLTHLLLINLAYTLLRK